MGREFLLSITLNSQCQMDYILEQWWSFHLSNTTHILSFRIAKEKCKTTGRRQILFLSAKGTKANSAELQRNNQWDDGITSFLNKLDRDWSISTWKIMWWLSQNVKTKSCQANLISFVKIFALNRLWSCCRNNITWFQQSIWQNATWHSD